MTEQTPRELLELADRERRTAAAVEQIGVTFRLGGTLAVKPGRFGIRRMFHRGDREPEFREMTGAESMALYRAAQIVRREALAEAERLEARVHAGPGEARRG